MEFMWWSDQKKVSFLQSLQRWTHPPLFIDKLKGSFWAWTQPMRGNLLGNTISNCLGPYPEWSSQSLRDHGVSQWEIKPSLNLAGAIPRMITDDLKLLSFNHISYGCSWNPAFGQSGQYWVQVVRNSGLQSPMRKKLATVTANRELTVSSRWPKWSQPAVTEPWPGPWLSCDLAVTEPWSYWRCRDWAVTSPWLSCDLAVTELWPRRDWAVTSPSLIIGPGAVATVVTLSSWWAHSELTVSSRWQFFSHGQEPYPPSITNTCAIIMRSGNTNGGFYGVWIGLHLFNDDTCSPVHISCLVWSFLMQFVKSLFGT